MSKPIDNLISAGIFPHGSDQQALYENRINRYFEREYKRIPTKPDNQNLVIDEGPLAKSTDELMDEHYDSDLPLFTAFLDPKYMAYTMAYYGSNKDAALSSKDSLEQAQTNKFRLICDRAELVGNEKVLSIGCGFGPLETYLFEHYPDLEITSITPSKVQEHYIRSLMNQPGHPLHGKPFTLHNIDLELFSTNALADPDYDVVFAVGVFEHINNIALAFKLISNLLKPQGRLFIHSINSVPTIDRFLDAEKSLIGKYFPGGKIWPMHAYPPVKGALQLQDSWFVNGFNYWRTLDDWHKRFWSNIESLFGPLLTLEQVRHWNDYFTLCKGCFYPSQGELFGNGHFLYIKADNSD